MELELVKFIKGNSDWEDILSSPPYSLRISRDSGYILFKYNQIESDFSIPLVQEARGIILRDGVWDIVCFPFQKFFNVQEELSSEIDWNTATVYEKLDGSLIKIWNDNDNWYISTNGTIFSQAAEISSVNPIGDSFFDLVVYSLTKQIGDLSCLDKWDNNNTYLFELLSPYTKVVVYHPETKIVHIATRNNSSGKYIEYDTGIEKVKQFPLSSLAECIKVAKTLPFDEEGYVVRDFFGNMVKIKSPAYVRAHRLVSNGVVTPKRILEIIEMNESDEFLSYFPEYFDYFEEMKDKIISLLAVLDSVETEYWQIKDNFGGRKELALWAKNTGYQHYIFLFHDGKVSSPEEWFYNLSTDKRLRILGYE